MSKTRLGTKSDLVEYFKDLFTQTPEYDAVIPAVVVSLMEQLLSEFWYLII